MNTLGMQSHGCGSLNLNDWMMSRWGNDIMVGKDGPFLVETGKLLTGLKIPGEFTKKVADKAIKIPYCTRSRINLLAKTIEFTG